MRENGHTQDNYCNPLAHARRGLTRTEELKVQVKKLGSAFLTHREVSAQEPVYRLPILSLPMKQLSRSVVFIDTNPKKERISVLKDNIKDLDDDDPNVFLKNLLDRYQHRPQEVQAMCLAEFAATFATDYKPKDDDESQSDVLPTTSSSEAKSSQITLTDGFGKMNT